MAVRYVEIGQYPDVRREVRGNLSEILVATANPGTYAAPEDVTGTYLEMGTDGLWTGASVGTLTQVEADTLYASGALASVKVGTPVTSAGTQRQWGGAGVGWVIDDPLFATKIGFLGDSIANGSTAGNALYAFPQQTVYLCGGRVAIQDSIEAGVPGETTAAMLARLPGLVDAGIGTLVLECGANDAKLAVSVADWADAVTSIATTCKARSIQLVMTMPFPQASSAAAAIHTRLSAYRVWLAQAAKALGITIAHVAELTDPATGYLAAAVDSGDGIHPNQLGHQYIAQAVAKSVLSVTGSTMAQSIVIAKAAWLGGVTNPLMDGTTIPSGAYEQPGGTGTAAVYSCISDTTGDLLTGKWWQSDITAAADTNRYMAIAAGTLAFAVGDKALVHAKIQVEDVSGDWVAKCLAGTASQQMTLNNGGANRHTAYYNCPGLHKGNGIYTLDLFWYISSSVSTSYEIWLRTRVPNGSHYKFRIGETQIYNLTALGLAGLPKMPTVDVMPSIPA